MILSIQDIKNNLHTIKEELPSGVKLVAVSKFHPAELIMAAYESGQKIFGESRVKEFLEKQNLLPKDIEWHFIGHLQTNKVKQIIGLTSLIESVDSERLLNLIDSESAKAGVMTKVLLQVHVAEEETKFGFYQEELRDYFKRRKFESLTHTHISGIMGMATNTEDENRIKEDFRKIASLYDEIRNDKELGLRDFNMLSMGMSGDWKMAVEEGSNIVRIGSGIFGERK